MKVLVFEHCQQATGHRIPYAALTAGAYPNSDLVVGLRDCLRGDEVVDRYFSEEITVDYYSSKQKSKPLANALEARQCLVRLVKKHRPDVVAIPTGDGLANVLGLFHLVGLSGVLRNCKIDICLMKNGISHTKKKMTQRLLALVKWWITCQGPWQRLMLIDPYAWSKIKNPAASKIFLSPDPVPAHAPKSKTEARQALGLPVDGRLIVSIGQQDRRKGVNALLRAFRLISLKKNYRLALIGKITDEVAPLLNEVLQQPGMDKRISLIDRFVTELEFRTAIDACDIVAVPYRSSNQPSGIVCRAIAWNRPILATNQGWLKWTVNELGAGYTTIPTDEQLFAASIEDALEHADEFELNSNGQAFARFNTEQNYQQNWKTGLEWSSNPTAKHNPLEFLLDKSSEK